MTSTRTLYKNENFILSKERSWNELKQSFKKEMLPISELVINAKVFYLELCNCDLVLFNYLNLYYIRFRIKLKL